MRTSDKQIVARAIRTRARFAQTRVESVDDDGSVSLSSDCQVLGPSDTLGAQYPPMPGDPMIGYLLPGQQEPLRWLPSPWRTGAQT